MEIKSYGKSDIGRVRSGNEDYYATDNITESENLYIVADGMGGHKAGNIASKMGTNTFIRELKKKRSKHIPVAKAMKHALSEANKVIFETANHEADKKGMGTTFSAILINNDTADIIHVGDSRIYLIRDGKIKRLTVDHTFVEKMLEEGRITPEEARKHPQKNILYMSLGAREIFNPFIETGFKLHEGDIFVLCSDGLTDMVEEDLIMQYCLSYPPKKAVEELIELGNRNGGIDNITVLTIYVGQTNIENNTHPIEIADSSQKERFSLKLLLILLTLIILIFSLTRILTYSGRSKQLITLSTLTSEQMRDISVPEFNNNPYEEDKLEKDLFLFKKKSGNKQLVFFKDFYIIEEGTGSTKYSYKRSGKKIRFEKIFFDKNLNTIIAFDDANHAYRITVK